MVHSLQASLPPSRPPNATIDVDLDSIPGTYVDAAYGRMTICALHDKTDAYRETLAGNPFPIQSDIPSFIAHFPKFWFNHLLFTHRNGSTFTVTMNSTYSERNVTVPSTLEWHDAVFDGKGMAWARGAWGAAPGVEERSLANGLEEGAEVWFEKE